MASVEVHQAMQAARPIIESAGVDADELFAALFYGMGALQDHLDERPKRFENAVMSVAAQLRKAYERGYDDRVRDDVAQSMAYNDKRARKARFVYFIKSQEGPIKIGHAVNVQKRLSGLQTSHAAPLKLLASTKGGKAQEIAYHKRFAAHRLHGEWFAPHPDILAEIDRLNSPHPPSNRAALSRYLGGVL